MSTSVLAVCGYLSGFVVGALVGALVTAAVWRFLRGNNTRDPARDQYLTRSPRGLRPEFVPPPGPSGGISAVSRPNRCAACGESLRPRDFVIWSPECLVHWDCLSLDQRALVLPAVRWRDSKPPQEPA